MYDDVLDCSSYAVDGVIDGEPACAACEQPRRGAMTLLQILTSLANVS